MREFQSMTAFASFLATKPVQMYAAQQAGLERCMKRIEKTARAEFGNYQPGIGAFPAWIELAEATKDDRVRQGYSENEPLLRSGDLRDSSQHEVHGFEGIAGSTDPIMAYQEFGTSRIPARPVWGPAALANKDFIERTIGAAVVNGLAGSTVIHPALGYDFTTP